MSRPTPSEDAVPYNVQVWVKFDFEIEADDDWQAEKIASYDWEDYKNLPVRTAMSTMIMTNVG